MTLFWTFLFIACESTTEICTDFSTVSAGYGRLTYDDQEQELEATWLQTGSSLQLNMLNPSADGASLTIRLNTSEQGVGERRHLRPRQGASAPPRRRQRVHFISGLSS